MNACEVYAEPPPANILVVEDQFEVREALSMLLSSLGHRISSSSSPEEALELAVSNRFELILLDMNYRRDTTSGAEGVQLISQLHNRGVDSPVIAMTAWGNVDVAVKAMQSGACDFIQKPWDNAHLAKLIDHHIGEQHRRHLAIRREKREWEDAVAVQRRLMPRKLPSGDGISVAAVSQPFGQIGGDYYDVFEMGDKIAVCIADVIGKGIPAALMMSNLQAAVRVTAADFVSPSEVCTRVNQLACMNGASDKFISFFYAVIDRQTLQVQYSNCGHNAPILHHANGSTELLDRGGTVLGLRTHEIFQQDSVQMKHGDRLLLYTDGLSEVENDSGEAFGEGRIRDALNCARLDNAESTLNNLLRTATDYCSSKFQDDVTAVMIVVSGKSKA